MKSLTPFLLLTLLMACNQSRKIPDNFDYGKMENNVYRNKYFGFELPVPPTWFIQNKEQMEQLSQEGQKMLEEKDKKFAEEVKADDINSASLLVFFKHKVDSVTGELNSGISIIVENLGNIKKIKTGADYLAQSKSLMEKSGVSYQFLGGIHSSKMGNGDFDEMQVIMTVNGVQVKQNYYAAIDKRFALCVIASFGTPEQEKELQDIMNGLTFK